MFLFTGNILVHAVIGASMTNGLIKGTISMLVMLILVVAIARADQGNEVKKNRKNRQKYEQGVRDVV